MRAKLGFESSLRLIWTLWTNYRHLRVVLGQRPFRQLRVSRARWEGNTGWADNRHRIIDKHFDRVKTRAAVHRPWEFEDVAVTEHCHQPLDLPRHRIGPLPY